jgi:hypothetical protein
MRDSINNPVMETLEGRALLSAFPVVPVTPVKSTGSAHALAVKKARPARRAKANAAAPKNYLVSFYGLGGGGFGNQVLTKLATEAGKRTGSTVWKFQESQGNVALAKVLDAIDLNNDHIIASDEAAAVNLRVVGYSFGAIQGANFARSLAAPAPYLAGYTLQAAVPVLSLVTIDPVNYTPFKHTDGVSSNVQNFTNFYEFNPGSSTIHLTNRKSGKSDGNANFSDLINPIGGTLSSQAKNNAQTLVDFGGPFAGRSVTQQYSNRDNGTMTGAEVNHETMPWYVYADALGALI